MEFINHITTYSLQCVNEMQSTIPFPIQRIANICVLDEYAPKCRKKYKVIHDFLNNYFMEHYKPQQIPKLFAIISTRYTNIETDISSFLLAMQYMDIYQKQRNENKLTELSVIFDERYPTETTFKGSIYNSLSGCNLENSRFPNGIKYTNYACSIFLNDSNKYSVYSSINPLDFAIDLVQILVKNDYNISERYQLRYKKLIIYMIKSYFALPADKYCEQQGRILILLSRYYLRCDTSKGTMDGINARKYATMAVNHLNEHIFESKFLVGAYGALYVAEKCLFNINSARYNIKMQSKLLLAKHQHKAKKIRSDCQGLLKSLNAWDSVKDSRLMQLKTAKRFYTSYWNDKKKYSLKDYGINALNKWIKYITNDKYYQIMKNICAFKECNYYKCKRKDISLLKCSGCVSVYYCCKTHQKIDWNSHHRNECEELKRRDYKFTVQLPYTIPEQLHLYFDLLE
eukprot:478276_1